VSKAWRSRSSPAARLRAFWLLGIVLVGVIGYAGYEALLWPGFHLAGVEVRGTHLVERDAVLARAALDPEVNIWLQDTRAVARRIEMLPYVHWAYVHRFLPASVHIDIVERRPAGCAEARNGERFTVDDYARVLEASCERILVPLYRLPDVQAAPAPGVFLHSARLARLQNDARMLERWQPGAFIAFTTDTFDELEATMRSGILVRFGGDADLSGKARLVGPILAAVSKRVPEIKVVDVRAPAAPIVEFRATHRAQD
jgi:hypothetical protein